MSIPVEHAQRITAITPALRGMAGVLSDPSLVTALNHSPTPRDARERMSRNPKAYLAEQGVTLPDEASATFEATTSAIGAVTTRAFVAGVCFGYPDDEGNVRVVVCVTYSKSKGVSITFF